MAHTRNTYDELPYESSAIAATSPTRLALVSALHGGPRPPVEGFRVLELGCGNGGNLLPLAFYHPSAELVGVDSSRGAIASARDGAAEIGARNVRFELMDLARPDWLLGERFDYVLVHGVFSWVPDAVRDGILAACGACPAPGGLVYLSYNVRAGWQVRTLVREILIDALGHVEPLRERVRQAKEMARRLREVLGQADHAQQVQLAWELERVTHAADSYLFHEYLLEDNRPFHHREVVAMLRPHGLAYLCDSSFNEAAGREPHLLADSLDRMAVEGEDRDALADFLGCRTFRSSVFCRQAEAAGAGKPVALDGLESTWVAADLRPEKGPADLSNDDPESFLHPKGFTVTATGAILKAALTILAEITPRYLSVADLLARARAACGKAALDPETVRVFHRDVTAMFRAGVVDLQAVAPRGLGGDGRGRLHALARLEVRRRSYLTTCLHSSVTLSEDGRELVRLIAAGREDQALADGRPLEECRRLLGRWGLFERDAEEAPLPAG